MSHLGKKLIIMSPAQLLTMFRNVFFYVDKSNHCDVEKIKTEPEEVEEKEFKEDKKALDPSRLRIDHSMLYCPP
jgi:hypothetical protein